MIMYRCDRCGKLFRRDKFNAENRPYTLYKYDQKVDLCSDCEIDIAEFMAVNEEGTYEQDGRNAQRTSETHRRCESYAEPEEHFEVL